MARAHAFAFGEFDLYTICRKKIYPYQAHQSVGVDNKNTDIMSEVNSINSRLSVTECLGGGESLLFTSGVVRDCIRKPKGNQ
jgi:hypothetical protein